MRSAEAVRRRAFREQKREARLNFTTGDQFLSTQEKRKETRYPFHWPVEIAFVSPATPPTCSGTTHDISTEGCSVLTEYNIPPGSAVIVRLALPPLTAGAARELVVAEASIVYTVLSAGHQKFRSGMQFVKFSQDGQNVLLRAIKVRAGSSVGRSG
jgi:hypothetical protein